MDTINAETSDSGAEVHYLTENEQILLARIRKKDQRAFRQLYEQYVDRIHALCLRLTGNPAMAEEAVQEVFIQVWRKVDSFSGRSTFYTWLYSVAGNTTLSYMRKQKSWLKNVISKDEDEHDYHQEKFVPGPDLSKLDRLIQRLPERARLVFVLHAVEGYRHEDIANKLGTSTGTSKAQFHRAKTLMKEWLENES